jgi:hypothetical protein
MKNVTPNWIAAYQLWAHTSILWEGDVNSFQETVKLILHGAISEFLNIYCLYGGKLL